MQSCNTGDLTLTRASTTTELIRGNSEDSELSVLTCKAITGEISPLPGVSTAERIHNDEDMLTVLTCKAVTRKISPFPGFSTAELIHGDEEQGFPTKTELIHSTEGQGSLPGVSADRADL